jgi:hypothetical protein
MKTIIYNIKRFIYQIFGIPKTVPFNKNLAMISGSTLFSNEYKYNFQFVKMSEAFKTINSPIIRVPFPYQKSEFSNFNNTIHNLIKFYFTPLILFDCYYSHQSMIERIDNIKKNFNNVIYFQLFNELPHMKYPGDQLNSFNVLLEKTDEYSQIIKKEIKNSKIISMSPANILHNISYESKWETNQKQLEKLIKQPNIDIIGVHCYVTSKTHEFNFKYLIDNLKLWNKENKPIWITETGIDGWNNHIKFYEEWCSRFVQYIPNLQQILWYRQSIDKLSSNDSGFALEERLTENKSSLYTKLIES